MRRHKPHFALSLALCLAALTPAGALAAAPTILGTSVTEVKETSATLKATINSIGKAGKFRFEYDTIPYATGEGSHGSKTAEFNFPNSASPVGVEAPITGLSPATTYHFRVVATNSEGSATGPDRLLTTTGPSLPFGPCPNEEFRSGNLTPADKPSAALPDCRAYEQASPVLKHGLDTVGTYPTTKASLSGDAITFATSSGIPGGEGAQEPPLYLSTRDANGWSTQGLQPPAETGTLARAVGWTPDFAHVFSWAQEFGEPEPSTFLDMPTDGGPLTQIYPYLPGPPPNFVGSSADGSKVFFEAFGIELADGEAPERNNLYVWDRASEEIALVGALPDDDCDPDPAPCAPPGGAVAGPYDWINGDSGVPLIRGGALSSYYTQEEHAVSEEGDRAYFTAAGGQLYVREDPLGPTPTTDRVSESEKDNGKGPEGTDAAGTQPAAFMAATPDGSKAFFTSSEKLTNDATTGPEPDKVAAIARADIGDGNNEDFKYLPAKAKGIAISGSHIYWADPSTNTIGRAKLGATKGEDVEAAFIVVPDVKVETEEPGVFEEVPARPQYVAVDPAAEHVYWTNAPKEEEVGERLGTIGRAKLGVGGPEDEDHEYITGASNPQGIAVNSEFIYWANTPPEGMKGNDTAIDETRTIGRAKPGAIKGEEVDIDFIKVGEKAQEFTPQGLAINATHIYTTIDGTQEISVVFRFDLEGQNRKQLFDNQHPGKPGLRGIALDAGHVYWAREGEDAIGRSSLDLEESSTDREWIKPADHPRGVAVNATHIHWAANQETVANPGNDLYRYDAEAPPDERLTDLTVDIANPNGIEVRGVLAASVDGSRVYFVANGLPGGLQGSPNEQGESAALGDCEKVLGEGGGVCNLYLWHDGTISFIARIEDERNWTGTPAGIVPSATFFQKTARLSADGQTLLFSSGRQLTSSDNSIGASELYRYTQGEGITCVSCRPGGEAPVGIPTKQVSPSLTVPESPASTLSRSLSANGNRIFFESTDALVARDTNGAGGCPIVGSALQSFPACQDVYQWEAKGTGSCNSEAQNGGCLSLVSTGKSTFPSFFLDASLSGDDVFIITRSELVRQDTDGVLDVYDAKVGGGLVGQNPVPDVCLSNPDCKPPQPAAPPPPPPVSEIEGGGNVKERVKVTCRKPKRLVKKKGKTRCVAKKQKKRHGSKRRHRADKSGGAGR